MKTVEIAKGVRSSILGFGCAPVLGAVGAKTAERALGTALDHGVTHFDVARSYGYGEAEGFLGRFFAGRRDQAVIATKFGIRATWRATLLRPLKPVVRALKARKKYDGPPSPAAPMTAPRNDPFHERVPLEPMFMRKSLEHSLRALRTDHVDVLFVHEPPGAIERLDDLAAAAEALKSAGKIKAWGLAYDSLSHELHAPTFDRFDVLQFDNSPAATHYAATVAERGTMPNVLFSPFRGSPGMAPSGILKSMWTDFPNSVVLCSMFTPEHIRSNADAANSVGMRPPGSTL